MSLKQWLVKLIDDHKRMLAMILPAFVVNYAVVALLNTIHNFPTFYILGPVLIGDIIGLEVNIHVFRRYGYPKNYTKIRVLPNEEYTTRIETSKG